jgi:hypothetical protein
MNVAAAHRLKTADWLAARLGGPSLTPSRSLN